MDLYKDIIVLVPKEQVERLFLLFSCHPSFLFLRKRRKKKLVVLYNDDLNVNI